MHLFVIHQFPDLDEYTPIIYKLDHKLKGMVKILSVFLVHDFREYELVRFLLKRKIQYYSLSKINNELNIYKNMQENNMVVENLEYNISPTKLLYQTIILSFLIYIYYFSFI